MGLLPIIAMLGNNTSSGGGGGGTVLNSYYVAASGNDSNPGSISQPWATIAKVNTYMTNFKAGDIINFHGGDSFTGNLLWTISGTSTAQIVIQSYGTGQANILGADATGIEVRGCQYVTVNNIKTTGSGVSTSGVTTNNGMGVLVKSILSSGAKYIGVHVTNNTVIGYRTGILYAVDNGTTPQTLWKGFDTCTIDSNDVSLCALAGIFTWSKSSGSPGFASGQFPEIGNNAGYVFFNFTITNNNVHDLYGSATNTGANANFGSGIRLVNMNGGTVNSNRVDNVGHQHNIGTPAGFESEFSTGISWRYNEASNVVKIDSAADGAGFDIFDGGTSNMIMEYNFIHDCDGYGIGGGGTGDGGSTGHRAGFNILVNNNRDGNLADIQVWGGMAGTWFYNNTVYSTLNGSYLIDLSGGMSTSYFTNNIFVSLGTRQILNGPASLPKFLNNLYWVGSSGGNLGFKIGATTYNTLAAIQGAGQETNAGTNYGVVGNPNFSSAGSSGTFLPGSPVKNMTFYDLLTGSAAKTAGVPMSAITGSSEGTLDYHLTTISSIANIGAVQ